MKACSCTRLSATRVGALARRRLPRVPADGRIHSVFAHALNIRWGDRGWLCLHDEERALNPYSVVVERSFFSLVEPASVGRMSVEPGQQVVVSRLGIEFPDSGIEVEFGSAPVWDSSLRPFDGSSNLCRTEPTSVEISDQKTARQVIFGRQLRNAARILRKVAAEREIASPLLSALLGSEARLPGNMAFDAIVRGRAAQLVSQFKQAWIDGRYDLAGATVSRVLGFGPGLTPSGDDFLLGVLGANHYFSAISEDADEDADRHANFVRGVRGHLHAALRSAGSTTIQSRLMLEASLAGHYPAPVSALLASIGEGKEEGIRGSVARLRNIGATSGEDVLAGILLWLDTRARRERS